MYDNIKSKKNGEPSFRWYLVEREGQKVYIRKREKECIELLSNGYTMKMIGRALNISPRTVEYYLQCVRYKLNTSKKFDLIRFFYQNRWE